jgi:flagellin
MMTKQYGSTQSLTITCDNAELAGLLGIPSAATEDGLYAEGTDVQADFATDADGKRIGFADSAVITTDGSKITVKDINNKSFKMDVPGDIAGTVYNDVNKEYINGQNTGKSTAVASTPADVIQEVTDVGTMSIHVGANENQVVIVDIPEVDSYTLGTDNINVMTHITAEQAIDIVDAAVQYANSARSKLGAYENRFEHTSNNIATSTENLTSSISTMTDTDMAEEMTEYTSLNVMTQAATSILAQANERPSTVLQILQ